MSDASSVYKICPQCGQSVSVAAKFCPTCGTPFTEENDEFVAYERYQQPVPPVVPVSETQQFTPVSGMEPQGGVTPDVTLYPGPDQSAAGQSRGQARTLGDDFGTSAMGAAFGQAYEELDDEL